MGRALASVTALLLLSTTACVPYPNGQSEFRIVVAEWNLSGIQAREAERILQDRGFKVGRYKAWPSWHDQRDYLYATRREFFVGCIIGDREWHLVLPIEKYSIAEVSAYVFVHCL